MTQAELAAKGGLKQPMLSLYERGEARQRVVLRLIDALLEQQGPGGR